MAEDEWSAAGFKPVRAAPAPRRGPTRSEVNRAQLRGTEASIANAYVNAAQGQAALERAPYDKASAKSDATVASATEQARIRKMIADADDAEAKAELSKLAAKYPGATTEQLLAASRYAGMLAGELDYQKALKRGYDPDAFGNKVTHLIGRVPWFGADVADMLRDEKATLATVAKRNTSAALLRQETGAAAKDPELIDVEARLFGSPFSVDSRETRASRARTRAAFRGAQKKGAGSLAGDVERELAAPSGKPTLEQFLKAARPANPGASVESLTAYYKKKYGAN